MQEEGKCMQKVKMWCLKGRLGGVAKITKCTFNGNHLATDPLIKL